MEGADATLVGALEAGPGGTGLEPVAGDVLGDACAVDSVFPGASRWTFRSNFITEKPITNTTTPKISGIGEMRSRPVGVAGRRGIAGVLMGLVGWFS
jgi:hypothetical protein